MPPPLKATILLGTLKRTGLSHTGTLAEFLAGRMSRRGVACDIVKLATCEILPGTYTRMEQPDDWPAILERVLASSIVIFATPIWWDNHSSLIQRAIERLDELHDRVLAGEPSGLEGKAAGIVITGDSDGAQHVIGNLSNFCNAIGLLIPPYGTLSVLWERQAKGQWPSREELLEKYETDYGSTAERMIDGLLEFTRR